MQPVVRDADVAADKTEGSAGAIDDFASLVYRSVYLAHKLRRLADLIGQSR